MATVIFVHGTGVREATYKESFQQVEQKLMSVRADLSIAPCLWGDRHGAALRKNGASIPDYDKARAVGQLEVEDYNIALWGLLYDDPLYELRLLALQTRPAGGFTPGLETPYQELDAAVKALTPAGGLEQQLRELGLANYWEESRRQVRAAEEYRQALQQAPAVNATYRLAVSRALVAQAVWLAGGAESAAMWMDGNAREALVESLLDALGGRDRGPVGWVKKHLSNLALRYVTDRVKRKRGAFSDQSFPAAGDILLYQARGDGIRGFIRDHIKQATPPIVLLAHSLGGIACVDLLVKEPLPQVEMLITVGSQAPFLYEIDALASLPFGQPLPAHFPRRWLNIYDQRDFLSYVARDVFTGEVQIEDIRVDNGHPFPQSHGAYWANRDVWEEITRRIPEV
jgi:pimeloyl-ACP methyl ester carboxylesterase